MLFLFVSISWRIFPIIHSIFIFILTQFPEIPHIKRTEFLDNPSVWINFMDSFKIHIENTFPGKSPVNLSECLYNPSTHITYINIIFEWFTFRLILFCWYAFGKNCQDQFYKEYLSWSVCLDFIVNSGIVLFIWNLIILGWIFLFIYKWFFLGKLGYWQIWGKIWVSSKIVTVVKTFKVIQLSAMKKMIKTFKIIINYRFTLDTNTGYTWLVTVFLSLSQSSYTRTIIKLLCP